MAQPKDARPEVGKKKGGRNLQGCIVGLIGLGRIGRKVAELLRSFGAYVVGFDPHSEHAWAQKNGVELLSLQDLLKQSDIVSLSFIVRQERAVRAQRKRDPFHEAGSDAHQCRQELVDEQALYNALADGHFAGLAWMCFRRNRTPAS